MASDQKSETLTWIWIVTHEAKRADLALLKAIEDGQGSFSGSIPSITRSQLKIYFEENRVTSQNSPIKANSKLKPGAEIKILFPEPQPMEITPEKQELEILFEDEHLAVINKPPGITVHPSPTQMTGTLVHGLLFQIKDLSGIGGVLRPGIVHRIDKDTSGALVITKSDLAHQGLAQTFARHEIDRIYWALCYGSPAIPTLGKAQKIESNLGRHPTDRKKMSMNVTTGRKAITHYRKLKEFALQNKKPFASWIEAQLETGRTHQVRVHLTGIGHSLLGDPVYGTPTENQTKWTSLPQDIQSWVKHLPGQALHARVLGFKHPITGEKLSFEASPPPVFQSLLNALEKFT